MKETIGDKQRILHILECIEEIESFTKDISFELFVTNPMRYKASIKNIEIIGEAAIYITESTKKLAESTIEWDKIIKMRHVLVHDYYRISLAIIWDIIQENIPSLKKELLKLI